MLARTAAESVTSHTLTMACPPLPSISAATDCRSLDVRDIRTTFGARSGEKLRDGRTNSPSCAGHERHPAINAKQCSLL